MSTRLFCVGVFVGLVCLFPNIIRNTRLWEIVQRYCDNAMDMPTQELLPPPGLTNFVGVHRYRDNYGLYVNTGALVQWLNVCVLVQVARMMPQSCCPWLELA